MSGSGKAQEAELNKLLDETSESRFTDPFDNLDARDALGLSACNQVVKFQALAAPIFPPVVRLKLIEVNVHG